MWRKYKVVSIDSKDLQKYLNEQMKGRLVSILPDPEYKQKFLVVSK